MRAKSSAQLMSCGSSASTACRATGRWRMAFEVLGLLASVRRPLLWASASVSRNKPASCVVKALVLATPISTPARVM